MKTPKNAEECARMLADARAENLWLRHELKIMEHKVITCGVAASHPDANLSRTGAYAATWDSPQAEDVRKLRAENVALRDNFRKAANVIRALVIEAGGTIALSDRSLGEAYSKELIEHRDDPSMLYKLSVK